MSSNVIIGTAGHVDHGKTCLVRALTGIDTDRLDEEKRRGITIEPGFAFLELPNGARAGIIDVPGHERFIKNMLVGAGGIDIALITVAADEGVMPQTREHVSILSLLGINCGVVALTKADAVDGELLETAREELREYIDSTIFRKAAIIPVSSVTGMGVEELRKTLFWLAAGLREKDLQGAFRLPIDRVFSLRGFGTVVTGTLTEGTISAQSDAMIYPSQRRVKLRGLEVHSQSVERAHSSQRVAVNLLKVKKEDISRGSLLASPWSMNVSLMADVFIQLLPDCAHGVKSGGRLHFYCGAAELNCRIVILGGRDSIGAGDDCYAQLRFEEPVSLKAGDRFVVRFFSPLETIGGGQVIDPCPRKHRRGDALIEKSLKARHCGGHYEELEAAILQHSRFFEDIAFLKLQTTLTPDEFSATLAELVECGRVVGITNEIYIHENVLQELDARLMAFLGEYHKENPLKIGARREMLKAKLFDCPNALTADRLIDRFCGGEGVEESGGYVRLSGFFPVLTQKQSDLKRAILKRYDEYGFSPPARSALLGEYGGDSAALFEQLVLEGKLVCADGETFFSAKSIKAALDIFLRLDVKGGVTLAVFRDALGVSRRYALAIMEYFDGSGITKKDGDIRMLSAPVRDN